MRVGIATDHAGFVLKQELLSQLRAAGHDTVDFGAHELDPLDDYPDIIGPLAQAVAAGKVTSRYRNLRQWRQCFGVYQQCPGRPCRAGP